MDNNELFKNDDNNDAKNNESKVISPVTASETNTEAPGMPNVNDRPASEASEKTVDAVFAQMRSTAANTSTASGSAANSSDADAREQSRPAVGGAPDFSKYRDTTSGFTSIPRETVYINNQKKQKAPKGRLGVGAVAAIVAVCMIFSGGAAFAGTYAANRMNGSQTATQGQNASGSPSVIFQSFNNTNKTEGSYEQVAAAVSPTVVEITTESMSTGSYMWGSNYVISGAGSGVIISADGLIITNNHVVSGASTINVRLSDGKEYLASLIGTDPDSDIAVIKIDATDLPCALIGDSDALRVGQEVVAVGNPLGEFGGSVTNGVISGLERSVTIEGTEMHLLQTNAAINPGNSGGGLFNLYGELVGIVNAKSSSSGSGTAVEGIGFAIPVSTASNVAAELVNYGYVRGRVVMGITYKDITNSWDAMTYRVNALGVYVVSNAYEENKLLAGDRIVAVDDSVIEYSTDLKSALKGHKVGDVITVKVVRNGQYVDVPVTLHEYVPTSMENAE